MALIYKKAANRIKAPNTQIGKNNVSIFDKKFPNEINRIAVWNGYATSSREVSNKQMKIMIEIVRCNITNRKAIHVPFLYSLIEFICGIIIVKINKSAKRAVFSKLVFNYFGYSWTKNRENAFNITVLQA